MINIIKLKTVFFVIISFCFYHCDCYVISQEKEEGLLESLTLDDSIDGNQEKGNETPADFVNVFGMHYEKEGKIDTILKQLNVMAKKYETTFIKLDQLKQEYKEMIKKNEENLFQDQKKIVSGIYQQYSNYMTISKTEISKMQKQLKKEEDKLRQDIKATMSTFLNEQLDKAGENEKLMQETINDTKKKCENMQIYIEEGENKLHSLEKQSTKMEQRLLFLLKSCRDIEDGIKESEELQKEQQTRIDNKNRSIDGQYKFVEQQFVAIEEKYRGLDKDSKQIKEDYEEIKEIIKSIREIKKKAQEQEELLIKYKTLSGNITRFYNETHQKLRALWIEVSQFLKGKKKELQTIEDFLKKKKEKCEELDQRCNNSVQKIKTQYDDYLKRWKEEYEDCLKNMDKEYENSLQKMKKQYKDYLKQWKGQYENSLSNMRTECYRLTIKYNELITDTGERTFLGIIFAKPVTKTKKFFISTAIGIFSIAFLGLSYLIVEKILDYLKINKDVVKNNEEEQIELKT